MPNLGYKHIPFTKRFCLLKIKTTPLLESNDHTGGNLITSAIEHYEAAAGSVECSSAWAGEPKQTRPLCKYSSVIKSIIEKKEKRVISY